MIRKLRAFIMITVVLTLIIVVSVLLCNLEISKSAKGKLYSDTGSIPFNKVGLLLGTSRLLANGYNNPYFTYRIQAAVKLMESGKIKYLIVSGDNSRKDYDEPTQMRADLLKEGIDSTRIYLDYAGFRTFDSMVRLKEIFNQDSVTVISQSFHNERAIYIASKEGIEAIGFNARDVSRNMGFRTQLREKLARVKVFLDYIFGTKPRYLGDKVMMP